RLPAPPLSPTRRSSDLVVAARRDPDLAAVLADHVGQREAFFATLVRHSQRRGDLDGDVSPEAVARLCFMIALGSLVMRALDLPRDRKSTRLNSSHVKIS